MPPHHPVFGHLFVIARVLSKIPKDAHSHYLPDQLRQAYPDMGPIFYIDAWPFTTLTLVVASPATLAQITTEHVLPKFPAIKDYLYPLANGKDIVSMDGREWKYWRAIFNPGFNMSHLMTLVPDIVKETTVFCEVLQHHALEQDMFRMKALTDNLAMDVIGKVVLWDFVDQSLRVDAYVLFTETRTSTASATAILWSTLFASKCAGWPLAAKETLSSNITPFVLSFIGTTHT